MCEAPWEFLGSGIWIFRTTYTGLTPEPSLFLAPHLITGIDTGSIPETPLFHTSDICYTQDIDTGLGTLPILNE